MAGPTLPQPRWCISLPSGPPGEEACYAQLCCSDSERELLPEADFDAWLTRFWSAKEVYGKMLGTGLEGNPKQFTVTHVDGERLRIGRQWIETRQRGDYVMAWSVWDEH